jgi:hypothetical protein
MNKRINLASLAFAAALLSASGTAGLAQSSWTAGDVGPVATSGSSFYDSSANSFSLISSGNGIWGTIDAFEFLSQDVTGDVQITARLASQQEDDPWAKAGVMLRQSADPGAPFAFGFATPANGINFQTRSSQADGAGSGLPSFQLLGAGAAPKWLRLIRSGNYVVGYRSEDGLMWDHPTAEQILLNGPFMAGLAASSRKDPSLPANPLADYHFDDAAGSAASDSSGNNKTGTLFGAAAWGNGKIKGALNLNGASGSYASLPSALVSGTGSYTLAA